jgi:hypothetical protein
MVGLKREARLQAEVPAIHVLLVFQRFSEPSLELNFQLDAVGSHPYGGRIPIR